MKFINLVLSFFLFIATMGVLRGQDAKEKIAVGVSAGMQTFFANNEFSLGTGQFFGTWMSIPIKKNQRLGLAINYRQLKGYQEVNARVAEMVHPTQLLQSIQTERLTGLRYWDFDLYWQTTWQRHRRWNWGGGFKVAALEKVRGDRTNLFLVVEAELDIGEYGVGYDYEPSIVRIEKTPLATDEFAALDMGAFVQIGFELMENLDCTATYYQGMNNLWGDTRYSDQDVHYLSQFSIGLSARLF